MTVSHYQDQGLRTIAQGCAFHAKERHPYLPDTARNAEEFEPHEWVREALRQAFEAGHATGCSETKKALRQALGIFG